MKNTINKYITCLFSRLEQMPRSSQSLSRHSISGVGIVAHSLLLVLLFSACAKQIEIKPEYQLDGSSPLATITEADNVLTGAYDAFQSGDYYSSAGIGPFSIAPDISSDDLIETHESLGNEQATAEWTYIPTDNTVRTPWLGAYGIISGVNIILRDIDNIASQDPKAARRIKGQALAIRAHVHFDLLRLYGESLDGNSTAKGVPYVTTFDVNAKPGRNTVKESYDKILADLSEAATQLSGELDKPINTATDKSRVDWLVVKAMQARVYLYAGQWQAAADAATAVISRKALSTIDEFPAIWNDESVAEVLWSVSFESVGDGAVYDNVYFARGNRSAYRPAQGLTTLYDQSNDVRYGAYMATVGDLNGTPHSPRLIVVKHLGKGNKTDGVVNWKAYRVAELYLIRAEANFKLTKESNALSDLNTLRENRIDGFTPGAETGTALWNAILTERRKELAFEGTRFFDFKRWNKTAINRCASNTDSPSTICSLASNNKGWAWPIPFNETNVNPNLKQNEGY
ncbi:RagB/SusD family nutrient uptake outer membrane protein [Paraflavitalea soli]|uniref:RagB/SusD family nutrient uptake outer membrane protein n=1 Tax=Paraflavitalea soli TaxID=2315862 RepID=A0A3B7MQ16_9BACT|nr:RagB/SusD family nutrient uptake outer membrane protein [Paraflavitalea soli]AXY75897.1 RagB/SusD family nutrient uptake outer membrane protein [Paraflavitalea soli]